MKLYATVTSERATKGQGGNNQLVINITVGNTSRREIANIVLRTTGGSLSGADDNVYALEYYPVNRDKGGRIVLDSGELETKGEKKTGERDGVCYCGYPCIHGTDHCDRHQTP